MHKITALDPQKAEPLYAQVKTAILEYIQRNQLQVNDLLPSERILSENFNVNRLTVRKAIEELIKIGVLIRRPGKGTYINQPKLQQRLLVVTSFSEAITKEGHTPGSEILQVVVKPADQLPVPGLDGLQSSQFLLLKRLRFVDRIPFSLATSYVPYHLVPGIETEIHNHSFYWLLENTYGLRLARTDAGLEATIADHEQARLLAVKVGSPLFLMSGTVSDPNGALIEMFQAYYRGDRIKFIVQSCD